MFSGCSCYCFPQNWPSVQVCWEAPMMEWDGHNKTMREGNRANSWPEDGAHLHFTSPPLHTNIYIKDNFYMNSTTRGTCWSQGRIPCQKLGACSRNWWCAPLGGEAGVGMGGVPMGWVTFIMAFDKPASQTVLKKLRNVVIDLFKTKTSGLKSI